MLTASYGGGAERLILDQSRFHDRDKFNIHIITLREGNIENEFRKLKSVKYLCLNVPKGFRLSALFKLISFIRKNKIKLVHAHLIEPEIYTVPLKIFIPGLKIITTKHNANEFKKKRYIGLLCKITSIFADKIISVSDEIKNFSIRYEFIKPDKILVFYNGIDIQKYKKIKSAEKLSEIRKKYGLKDNDFLVGIVGRLTKQKGHNILIRAAELLKDKISNLKIMVIGEGELRQSLVKEVSKRGLQEKLLFTGHVDDMKKIYAILDILCMPSLWEGLSVVLLESMSMKKLVILSDLPNNREVAEDGNEAVYFQTGNHEELADKIFYYYQNPEYGDIIKLNARKKIIEEFNYIDNLNKIEGLYTNILKTES